MGEKEEEESGGGGGNKQRGEGAINFLICSW